MNPFRSDFGDYHLVEFEICHLPMADLGSLAVEAVFLFLGLPSGDLKLGTG